MVKYESGLRAECRVLALLSSLSSVMVRPLKWRGSKIEGHVVNRLSEMLRRAGGEARFKLVVVWYFENFCNKSCRKARMSGLIMKCAGIGGQVLC